MGLKLRNSELYTVKGAIVHRERSLITTIALFPLQTGRQKCVSLISFVFHLPVMVLVLGSWYCWSWLQEW